ncbi:hypothetical protein QF028_001604 [Neobacillus sp. B4I6]|uniref:hypothetical protein n=1 Tax=Neobacillus sp. B4I6 TaxID=3373925 RepID=UPI003D236168
MKSSHLINKINNNDSSDYKVEKELVWVMDKKSDVIMIYLRNDNRDNTIRNPYKVALDLIRYGSSVLEVTIVEWEEYNAISYFRNKNDGKIDVEELDFDKFVKRHNGKMGMPITEIYFTVLPLDIKQLADLNKMNSFKEVVEYIKSLPYDNPLKIKSLPWEIRDFIEQEDNDEEEDYNMEEPSNSVTLQSIFSPYEDDLPF